MDLWNYTTLRIHESEEIIYVPEIKVDHQDLSQSTVWILLCLYYIQENENSFLDWSLLNTKVSGERK